MSKLEYDFSALSDMALEKYTGMAEDELPSIATYAPAIMVVNLTRSSVDVAGQDDGSRSALLRRPLHQIVGLTEEEIAVEPMMSAADKTAALQFGHQIIVEPFVKLRKSPRGRRQLSAAEASITEALRLWTYALLPAIAMQIQGTPRSGLITDQTYDWLSEKAPNLVRLASTSAAGAGIAHKARNSGADDGAGDLPGFLNALSDAGRKLSMQFPDEEAPRKGEALRAKVDAITQGVRQGQEREKNLAALLEVRVHVLDVLAKARRIATEVERALLEATSQSEAGFERLDGLGPYEVARNADDFGKRLVGASKKVIHSQRPSAYVQQTNDTDDRLSVPELAVVAMLCDIDPFLITAQHVLLHDELIAMRQVGRAFRSEQFNRTYLLHLETLRREYSGDTPLGQQEILQVYLGFPQHLMFEARG